MEKTEIRRFVKMIANVKVTFKKEGFWYDDIRETINIDLTEQDDYGFLRHLREVHKCKFADKFPLLLWSILHEIGHYYTYDECDCDGELNERVVLSMVDNDELMHSPKIQDQYFNLESEWVATEWAIKFVAQNKKALANLF